MRKMMSENIKYVVKKGSWYIGRICIVVIIISSLFLTINTANAGQGNTIPDNISNLKNISYAPNYINWTWIDPNNIDPNLLVIEVYIDGKYKTDVPPGVQFYNATKLEPYTMHTIGIQTFNIRGYKSNQVTIIDPEWTARLITTHNISGFKINDTNGNGIKDPGENGIENWKIVLSENDLQIDSTLTNKSGFYNFTNLVPGSYNVTEENRSGFVPTNVTFKTIVLNENMDDVIDQNFTNELAMSNPNPPPILNKEVQGYYTMSQIAGTDYNQVNYSLISTLVYGYAFIIGNGSLIKSIDDGYDPGPVISYAHSKGVKVTLQIAGASKADLNNLLSNSTAMDLAVDNLLDEAENQSGYTFDGIDTDFENFDSKYKSGLTEFQNKLSTKFLSHKPKWSGVSRYHMTMAVPMDSSINNDTGRYDLNNLQKYVDYIMVMGYDWYGNWASCSTSNSTPCAGSNAPMADNNPVWPYGIKDRIHYIETLMDKNKLLLGIPWYGYIYKTVSNSRSAQLSDTNSLVIGYGDYVGQYKNFTFDSIWQTPWYAFQDDSGQWWQAQFDNLQSLGIKYDFVNSEGLSGIGIYNLLAGFNTSTGTMNPDLWDLIASKFSISLHISLFFSID